MGLWEKCHPKRCTNLYHNPQYLFFWNTVSNNTSSPWVPSREFPQPWHHEQCNGLQSFHFYEYQRIVQYNGLWRKRGSQLVKLTILQTDLHRQQHPPTLGEDGSLSGELFQHFSRTGQPVTALTHTDVQAQLADAQLPHRVLLLLTLVLYIQTNIEIKLRFTWTADKHIPADVI